MKKIGIKLRIISWLMIAIPLAALAYFFIYENAQERRVAEVDKNIMITRSAALLVENEVTKRKTLLEKLAKLPVFKSGNPAEVKKYLEIFGSEADEGLFVADTKGKLLAQTISKLPQGKIDISQYAEIIKTVKDEAVVSAQHKSVFNGEYAISICVPVLNEEGRITRVISTQLTNKFFKKLLDPIKIGQTGRLSLVDSKGYYIYDKSIESYSELVESKCYYDGKGKDLSVTERASIVTGEKTIFTKVKIKSLEWYVVAFQRSEEITAPLVAAVTKNLVTLVMVFVIVLVLSQYQKSLLEQRELVQKQNAEKLALVGELAAGMAHEVRNPLTAIKGFTKFLADKGKYQEDTEVFSSVMKSVQHIEDLINEILLMAKPEKLTITHVNLKKMIEELFEKSAKQAEKRGVKLELDYCDYPLLIKGDESQLKQALGNFLKNSLEAVQEGGSVKVSMDCPDRMTAKIKIIDNGVGISPEDFGKIGTPFFTTKDNGTGLGFLVSQRIVEEHGGSIEIKSMLGKGTTIEVYFPLA